MPFVCLWSPTWQTGAASLAELAPALLECAPRIALADRGRCWADATGLDEALVAHALVHTARAAGHADVCAGVADTPIAAEMAARQGHDTPVTLVPSGGDREFIAPLALSLLTPSPPLATLLDGVGLETCEALARLDSESVEVRLGAEGRHLWRLARGDDRRLLFSTPPHPLPNASFDWVEYTLIDVERLLFVINALVGTVCAALAERGQQAHVVVLVFSLANRAQVTRTLEAARATASQHNWMRMIRADLERLELEDAVSGIAVRVELVAGNDGPQGDLFDRGFASAPAVERALADVIESQGEILVAPRVSEHPLLDRREEWAGQRVVDAVEQQARGERREGRGEARGQRPEGDRGNDQTAVPLRLVDGRPSAFRLPSTPDLSPLAQPLASPLSPLANLSVQLLPAPAPITVSTSRRRDHDIPLRYRDGNRWHTIIQAAGPDRVSGGEWETGYAREYFRCVREDGMLVWIFRDAGAEKPSWFLHGWWD